MATDTANKSNLINAMLLRAWRERWDDAQWGTHIKSVSLLLIDHLKWFWPFSEYQ